MWVFWRWDFKIYGKKWNLYRGLKGCFCSHLYEQIFWCWWSMCKCFHIDVDVNQFSYRKFNFIWFLFNYIWFKFIWFFINFIWLKNFFIKVYLNFYKFYLIQVYFSFYKIYLIKKYFIKVYLIKKSNTF